MALLERLTRRIVRTLTRAGWIEAEPEQPPRLSERVDPEPFADVMAHSIRYRIAKGRLRGRKDRHRAAVVSVAPEQSKEHESATYPHRLSWIERLKRVFKLDLTICTECGGPLRLIAAIEQPRVLERILAHLQQASQHSRAPPVFGEIPVQVLLLSSLVAACEASTRLSHLARLRTSDTIRLRVGSPVTVP